MDILYELGEATVRGVQAGLPDPPTPMAVRRMLQILEGKAQVRRRKVGRGFVYMPKQARGRAGAKALSHVIGTFFGGSMEEALAAHLGEVGRRYSAEELERMARMIEEARRKED